MFFLSVLAAVAAAAVDYTDETHTRNDYLPPGDRDREPVETYSLGGIDRFSLDTYSKRSFSGGLQNVFFYFIYKRLQISNYRIKRRR